MSWVRIWVHMVFCTKNRAPFLHKEIRNIVFDHIMENAKKKDIFLDVVNGYAEHAHCLISLNKKQSISEIAQLIKGESSMWINKNKLINNHFNWQDDYWAVSISESLVCKTRKYILNQEEHHSKKTFTYEVDDFMNKFGWQYIVI